MDVHVVVDGQRMMLQDSSYRFAPRSQEFVRFIFDLSDDWTGLTVFAQFSQNEIAYNVYLDNANRVYLPSEITSGLCTLMLYGTGSGGVTGTTLPITLCIDNDCFSEDGQSTVITQSLYNQLIERLSGYLTNNNVASLAEVRTYLGL